MEQQGYIIEIIDNQTAKLKMQRHSACASCGKCTTTSEKKDIIVEVDNTIGAKVGDRVVVNMESVNVLKATIIVYAIPLIWLMIGTIATYFTIQSVGITNNIEIISGIVGLILMMAAFFVIKTKDRKYRESREYIPIVTKIIVSKDNEIKI
ncbi:MAG: SoxR reducing system RseC family protein [Peptostreptococcaceae bacterium]